jgi:mitochondrial chaperone BCS1
MTIVEIISAALAANPYLAGGIGTMVAGSVLYALRTLPEKIGEAASKAFSIKLYVESMSNEYRDVDGYIETLRLDLFSRSLEIKDGSLKTGFGSGWGVFDGTLFRYSKSKSTQQIAPFETIAISFLTRDRSVIERFLNNSKPADYRNSVNVTVFSLGGNVGSLRRRKRGLETVFVDEAVKKQLVDRFTWFLGAEAWHSERGIPWKLGVILHGPPGTGKTSLIHALASSFDFNIKYIKSLHALGAAFMNGGKSDLFVIEDIDAISGDLDRRVIGTANQGMADPARGAPLHEILNAMDGMQTPDGLKFIVTTNHIARLDPAIVRPGRIDEVIEVGPLSIASARQMFKAFYRREGMKDGTYTPRTGAELQQMFSLLAADEAERELMRGIVSPGLARSSG